MYVCLILPKVPHVGRSAPVVPHVRRRPAPVYSGSNDVLQLHGRRPLVKFRVPPISPFANVHEDLVGRRVAPRDDDAHGRRPAADHEWPQAVRLRRVEVLARRLGPARLVVPLGYVIGFLIVIFGRLQLFTENTIAAILPLAVEFSAKNWIRVGRLWAIVFSANLFGALIAGLVFNFTPMLQPGIYDALIGISEKAVVQPWFTVFARAVPAGFLIAALVWMMPSSKGSEFLVVSSIIYVLVLGGFTHVVVGATEALTLLLAGDISLWHATWGFTVPAFLGNVVGGAALFAMLAYAQIRDEVRTGIRDRMI